MNHSQQLSTSYSQFGDKGTSRFITQGYSTRGGDLGYIEGLIVPDTVSVIIYST
jgi:hypothetical protein